jgi:putative phosphoesterase
MRIGLISDTHQPSDRKSLWDEVRTIFAGVDLILHAGDIVEPVVLDWLEEIAPVLAAKGNNDFGWQDIRVREVQLIEVGGHKVAVMHDMPEGLPIPYLLDKYFRGERVDVIVTGHTHVELMHFRDGVLQINPGSATHPHLWSMRLGTIGLLEVVQGDLNAQVLRLGELPGLRNPGSEFEFSRATGIVVERRKATSD